MLPSLHQEICDRWLSQQPSDLRDLITTFGTVTLPRAQQIVIDLRHKDYATALFAMRDRLVSLPDLVLPIAIAAPNFVEPSILGKPPSQSV